MRGPNWVEARVSATMVIEKTTPTTVMMAAAMAVSTCRAESGVPPITQLGTSNAPRYTARSSRYVPTNSATAASTSTVGTNHRFVRSASRRRSDSSRIPDTMQPSCPGGRSGDQPGRMPPGW
ncbi:hypothetical protein NS506_02734 [Nocardia seriolae]|uniref:Secreted protein n=1 Tax=Nocardia seriolae TaxID=37332 RepID=A0ABC8ARF2_9NOCA|nr:hypothetical protein NS506_02734 [Nocardia seriolae]